MMADENLDWGNKVQKPLVATHDFSLYVIDADNAFQKR
jgi:hypothetical protein